jgi:uncharacterized protein YdbL (DUF1318 family)
MNIEKSPFETESIDTKQTIWNKIEKEIEDVADVNGKGIEDGIKNSIIALNANQIPTIQSCEGHFEMEGGHRPWPWIDIASPDEPEERFVDESKIYEEFAERNNISVEDLKRGRPWELYVEARKVISANSETEEYQKWCEKNHVLYKKVEQLLGEFYQERIVTEGIKLALSEDVGDSFELSSVHGLLVKFLDNDLSEQVKKELLEKLSDRQKEMGDFSAFLKEKFLKKI